MALIECFKLKAPEADALLAAWVPHVNTSNSRLRVKAEQALAAVSRKLALRGIDASAATKAISRMVR